MRGTWAIITGATSGIGEACAVALAERGVNLVVTGRRATRLERVAADLSSRHGVKVKTLNFDVADRAATEKALDGARAEISEASILINNAGLALGTDSMPTGNLDDWDRMIDTNVKGLLYMTRFCLPFMIKNERGHIVNLGSVAGRWIYPGGGIYCASKFAVRALTEGLRLDLMGTRVRVTNIEPGMVETEFSEVRFGGDQAKAKSVYKGFEALKARDIAETILWCLERPAHVNIQELVIFPTDQAGVGPHYLHRRG